jgi:sulfite reductase alpha subunit-like flavoprotein
VSDKDCHHWLIDNILLSFPYQDRAYALKCGEEEKKYEDSSNCHLFFGCRTHGERIYRGKIENWEEDDVLNFHLALSRSPDREKMYVQDMIKEKGETICELLLRDD